MAKSKPAPTKVIEPDDQDHVHGSSELPLTRAIFIYERRERPREGAYTGRVPAERVMVCHDVAPNGVLGAGALVDAVAFADAIVDAAARDAEEALAFQTDRILAQGRGTVVWWRAAAPAKLYFRLTEGAKDEARYTALNGRDIPLPALVFRGSSTGIKVWALADNKRPTPETALFTAPFMNLVGGGPLVCLGSARSPDLRAATSRASAPDQWEKIFFESNFTHTPPALAYDEKIPDYPTLLEYLVTPQGEAAPWPSAGWPFPVKFLRPCDDCPTLAAALDRKGAA